MATDASHAATHDDRTFSVEILSGGQAGTVLAAAVSEFLDALDCAMEWLEREDPARTRSSSIGIFATRDGVREQVWTYPTEAAEAEPETKPLVELFGFDPVAWKAPAGEFDAGRARPTEAEVRPAAAPFTGFVAAVADQEAEVDLPAEPERKLGSPPVSERLDAWLKTGNRLRLRDQLLAVWGDKLSRCCLILGVVCLWLTLTLLEPAFLAPLLAAAAALWSRRGHREPPAADGVDDWF